MAQCWLIRSMQKYCLSQHFSSWKVFYLYSIFSWTYADCTLTGWCQVIKMKQNDQKTVHKKWTKVSSKSSFTFCLRAFYDRKNLLIGNEMIKLLKWKTFFTIDARALYNTLRSKWFSFAPAVSFIAQYLVFVASVLVVALSLLKILNVHTNQTRPNAIQITAMQRANILPIV